MLKTKELLLLLLHSSLETAVIIIVCAQLQIKNVYFLIHSKVVHCFLIMPIEIKANNHTILITVTKSISFALAASIRRVQMCVSMGSDNYLA